MALSNWDTLAFGPDGKPGDGALNYQDKSVQIYKNWLYVRDPEMWTPNTFFEKPTIAEVQYGSLDLGVFTLHVARGKQEGVYVYTEVRERRATPSGGRQRMTGIGCYGFSDPVPRLAVEAGVDLKEWDEATHGSTFNRDSGKQIILHLLRERDGKPEMKEYSFPDREELESQYIGVTEPTVMDFYQWLDELVKSGDADKGYVDKVKSSDPTRFNQGDAYFAGRGVVVKQTIATEIGAAKEPTLLQALRPER